VFDLERFTGSPRTRADESGWPLAAFLLLDSESEYDLRTPNGKKAFRDRSTPPAYYSDRCPPGALAGRSSRRWPASRNGSRGHSLRGRPAFTQRGDEAAVLRELTARFLAGELQDALIRGPERRGIPTASGQAVDAPALKTLLTRQRTAAGSSTPTPCRA